MKGKKVKCLGWCNGELVSNDPSIRFCKKCRQKRDNIDLSARERISFNDKHLDMGQHRPDVGWGGD